MKRMIRKMKGKAVIFIIKIDKKRLFRFSISKTRLTFKFIRFTFKTKESGHLSS